MEVIDSNHLHTPFLLHGHSVIPAQSETPVVFILPFPALCAQFG